MCFIVTANQLAYISGEGRFFVENKKMTISEMPTSKQQKEYTPKGFVDLDLEWFSKDLVIVARAKENKEWKELLDLILLGFERRQRKIKAMYGLKML